MNSIDIQQVVVGVDGSANGWPAVLTGAWEAQRRNRQLLIVHGFLEPIPYTAFSFLPSYPPPYDAPNQAREMLHETAKRISEVHDGLTVDTKLLTGGAAEVLVDASRKASMVIVGARGDGGFGGLSLGSVAAQVAAHARSPVLVVRSSGPDTVPKPGPVVVGLDGSSQTAETLAFAFNEAQLRQVPLVAAYAWWMLPRDNLGPVFPGSYDDKEAHEEASRLLAETLAGWSVDFPDVTVEQRPIHSMNPSYALIRASAEAGLVVVGSRGRGGFTGLLLGSVSRDLVGHAHCPVAVVHPSAPDGGR